MLTHDEHQAMIMFDRLLMAAKDNETIADLLDQTLNVARMIDPRSDEKILYGPLQRIHFEWQQLKYRMGELEKKMDNYINQQNRYGSTYTGTTGYATMAPSTGVGSSQSMWPSNPGWEMSNIKPLTATDIINNYAMGEENIKKLSEKLEKIAIQAKNDIADTRKDAK